jgi:molecular chaperone GrpE
VVSGEANRGAMKGVGKKDPVVVEPEEEPMESGDEAHAAVDDEMSGPPDGAEGVAHEDALASKLQAAEEQARDHYDRLLRVSAEFENYRKRTAREMRDVIRYANEKLAKELLAVVDNLERAIESASQCYPKDDPLLQGVHLTLNETLKILERHHVAPIKSLGEPFDPNFHQAMLQAEAEDQPPNTVVDELQKGYMIHDRLLRPALVAVSKGGGAQPKNED